MQREEIGKLSAASIFLACKLGNEHRRIRDVINIKHMLQFDSLEDGTVDQIVLVQGQGKVQGQGQGHQQKFKPPPLDEEYWKSKEEMVRMEQTFLRIIKFDVNVSFPHRILVVVWEELVTCTCQWQQHDDNMQEVDNNIHLKEWRNVLKAAWRRLNDACFHVDSLMCNASDLACGAISLALNETGLSTLLHRVQGEEWWEWIGVDKLGMEQAKEKLTEAATINRGMLS